MKTMLNLVPGFKQARTTDPTTSKEAAVDGESRVAQRYDILYTHSLNPGGLTDDEVAFLTGEDIWRRCTDLRRDGYLEWVRDPNGDTYTRTSRQGRAGGVSRITADGLAVLAKHKTK